MTPMMRNKDGELVVVDWEDALIATASALSHAQPDEVHSDE